MTQRAPSEDNQRPAKEAAKRQAPETTLTFKGKAAEDVMERLTETEETRKQEHFRLEKRAANQAHLFRWIALGLVVLFALIPLFLLGALGWSVFFGDLGVFVRFVSHGLGAWPVGVFITGVFASFIAVFGFLAKGVFGHSRRKDGEEESPNGIVRAVRVLADKLAQIFPRNPPQ